MLDVQAVTMAIDRVLNSESMNEQEDNFNTSLRPTALDECIGQENVKEKLTIAMTAAISSLKTSNACPFYFIYERQYPLRYLLGVVPDVIIGGYHVALDDACA